jgi:hypothetical protein
MIDRGILWRLREWNQTSLELNKGRDGQLVLLTLKEKAQSRKFRNIENGETALLIADVKSAFPSLWRQALAKRFIDKGMPPDLYKRWRSTSQKMGGHVRIGPLITQFKTHHQGVNQGVPLASDEWTMFMEKLADELQKLPKEALARMPSLMEKKNQKHQLNYNNWMDIFYTLMM